MGIVRAGKVSIVVVAIVMAISLFCFAGTPDDGVPINRQETVEVRMLRFAERKARAEERQAKALEGILKELGKIRKALKK